MKTYTKEEIEVIISHSEGFYYQNDDVWKDVIRFLLHSNNKMQDFINKIPEEIMLNKASKQIMEDMRNNNIFYNTFLKVSK